MDYFNNLTNQFSMSTGIYMSSYENYDEFSDEFFKWIKNRNDISGYIASFLDENILNSEIIDSFEIDKGKLDSLFSLLDLNIISKFIDEDEYDNIPIVLNGEFKVIENNPIIKLPNSKVFPLDNIHIEHILTTNPYNMDLVKGWDDLINKGNTHVTIGVYGSLYDLDMSQKINELKKFRDKLYNYYEEDFETIDDSYFYLITSIPLDKNNDVKRKILM